MSFAAATAIVRYALAEAGIAARVYSPKLPEGGRDLFPCALVTRIGGQDAELYVTDEQTVEIDIRFLAATQREADAMYQAMRRLHGAVGIETTGFVFDLVSERLSGADLPEQVTPTERWDCVYCSYSLRISTGS